MRTSTVLAAVSTLLLTLPIAKAQSPCVSGFTASVAPAPKRGSPFTATVKLTLDQKLADGNAIHGEVRYQIARDASGKTMSELPMNCAPAEFTSFDNYLASVPSAKRRTIKKSREKFAKFGFKVVHVRGGEGADRFYTDDVHALYDGVLDRAKVRFERHRWF